MVPMIFWGRESARGF